MNDFKFFIGETIPEPTYDPFQSVPENYRVESVSSILYDANTNIPFKRVFCRHIVTEELDSFLITDTHWLWDFVPTN